jgi:hypothetical protein
MPAQGHASYIALAKEATWATKVVAGMSFMEFLNETIAVAQEEKIVQGINRSRVRTKRLLGAKTVAGDITWEVNAEDGIGLILKGLLPAEAFIDDGVGNGGQHAFTVEGGTIPPGLTYQKEIDGNTFDYYGGRVSSANFQAQAGEILNGTASLTFKDRETGTPQVPVYTTQKPLIYHTGTLSIDGSDRDVQNFQVAIDGGMKADRRRLGQRTILQQQPGSVGVTGQIVTYYDNDLLIDKFLDGSAASLIFDFTGELIGSTLRRLRFTIPTVYLNGEDPKVPGMDEVMLTIPFVGIRDGSGTPDNVIKVELFNSVRAAY